MKNLMNVLTAVNTQTLTETDSKMKQTEAVALKHAITNAILADINEVVNAYMTTDGIIMEVPNETLGALFVAVNAVVKPVDYDLTAAEQEYNEKLAVAAEKLAKKEKDAAERKAKNERMKEKKAK